MRAGIANEERALAILFGDERNARAFFETASLIRWIYPPEISRKDARSPLQYALDEDICFHLGQNLYFTPVTESFRRHLIFGRDRDGAVAFRFEVLIPGEIPRRWRTGAGKRKAIMEQIHAAFPGKEYCVRPLCWREYPDGDYDLYCQKIHFDRFLPMEILAYDYPRDGKRLESVTSAMLSEAATHWRLSRTRLERMLVAQLAEIVAAVHSLGWLGAGYDDDGRRYGLHTGNFRFSCDAEGPHAVLVGDFSGFVRYHDATDPEKEKEIDVNILVKHQDGRLVPGLEDFLELSVPDILEIFGRG